MSWSKQQKCSTLCNINDKMKHTWDLTGHCTQWPQFTPVYQSQHLSMASWMPDFNHPLIKFFPCVLKGWYHASCILRFQTQQSEINWNVFHCLMRINILLISSPFIVYHKLLAGVYFNRCSVTLGKT